MDKQNEHIYNGKEYHIIDMSTNGAVLVYGDVIDGVHPYDAKLFGNYPIEHAIGEISNTAPEFAEFLDNLPHEDYQSYLATCPNMVFVNNEKGGYNFAEPSDMERFMNDSMEHERYAELEVSEEETIVFMHKLAADSEHDNAKKSAETGKNEDGLMTWDDVKKITEEYEPPKTKPADDEHDNLFKERRMGEDYTK